MEQIPQALEVVFHLTAASHDVAAGRIVDTVAGTAGDVHGLSLIHIFSVAVLAIIVTAPLGALGIDCTYKRLLKEDKTH